jgi:hypothetical protein
MRAFRVIRGEDPRCVLARRAGSANRRSLAAARGPTVA